MADWISQNPTELLAQMEQFETALNTPAGRAASGLSDPEFAALSGKRAALQSAEQSKRDALADYRAAVAQADLDETDAIATLRTLGRVATNAANMTNALRQRAGLTPRSSGGITPAPLPQIADLAAVPALSGDNRLAWTGPTGGSLQYLVYGRVMDAARQKGAPGLADEDGWALLGATTGTAFVHQNAGLGVPWTYRTVPQRGQRQGEPSNDAAVFA